jgi:hypothetical protein
MAKNIYGAAFVTPHGRISFPHLFEKGTKPDGTVGNYSCGLLIPKTVDISAMLKSLENVAIEAFGKQFKTLDALKHPPVRDGDKMAAEKAAQDKDGALYKGHWYISPTSDRMPGVVDRDGKTGLSDKDDVYGGCWARFFVQPASYNFAGNWGVKFYLQGVQKVKDDSRFGGGSSDISSAFEAIAPEAVETGKASRNF